ncbi:uncharacterized protein G6M90_00g100700 [Metarhizium brunneum]|uniref:Methyltransferase domain-containing protein n=1 Tax=Metarhizium brunneum TaxID=500148 RepID=A0A7D5V3W5_9HYPO
MTPRHFSQFEQAQKSYQTRAKDYDSSWHPQYTARFMELIDIQPGDRVLVLACGTGLEAVIACPLVGDNGLVTALDASAAMMDVCRKKQATDEILSRRLVLIQHDVTDLESCEHLEKGSYDVIICSNAFVLFDDPGRVVSQWAGYLRRGGRLIVDIPHENHPRQGLFMKKAIQQMGMTYPASRSWIESVDSFRGILEARQLHVFRVEALDKEPGKGHVFLGREEIGSMFDYITQDHLMQCLADEQFRSKARLLFEREWDSATEREGNGKVKVSYVLYVYVAEKV